MNATLNRINVNSAEAPKTKSKTARPVAQVEGDIVRRYNLACDNLKTAEAAKKELEPSIKLPGLDLVINTNLKACATPIGSVEVTDETGATTMVTLKDAYGAVDADAVSAVFSGLKLNVNDFVFETIEAKFDSSVFFVDGCFNQERFNAFKKAIEDTATKFKVANPLSTSTKVTAKEDFHSKRWAAIPDFAKQKAIQQILPAQVAARKVCDADPEKLKAFEAIHKSAPTVVEVPAPTVKIKRAKL
jgi:hypothetical protein